MTSDAPTNVGKHVTSNTAIQKRFSLLIGRYGIVLYDVAQLPAVCRTKRHFKRSNRWIVDMLIKDIVWVSCNTYIKGAITFIHSRICIQMSIKQCNIKIL